MVLADSFYYQPVQIDTINTRVNADLFAKEGDANGRGMVVQITENGIIKDTTGITLRLQWSHISVGVSGFTEFEVVDATKGLYKLIYPTSMLHRGRVEAFIRITDNGILSGTRNLLITVERMVGSDETIEASDDFSALQTALTRLSIWEATISGKVDTWEADMEATKQLYIDTLSAAEAAYPQEFVSLTSQLAETPKKEDVFLKAYGININDLDEPTRQAFLEAQGIDVNYVLGEGNVKPINTTFFRKGKNLFNKNAAEIDKAVNEVYGTLFPNTYYAASEFIEILPSTQYTENRSLYLSFYDFIHTFISGLGLGGDGTKARTFTTPENAKYVRVTVFKNSLDSYQLEKGNSQTAYEPFKQFIPSSLVEEKPFDVDDLPNEIIRPEKTTFFEVGKNLFNKNTVTLDRYINWDNGNLDTNSTYVSSDFISVEPAQPYSLNNYARSVGFDNAEKTFISGIDSPAATFTTPANAAYMRLSPYKTDLDIFQVEKGSVVTPYEKFGYVMDNSSLKNPVGSDELLVFLPAEICVAVGRTIELYNKQAVWCGNIDNYHIKWDCSIGKAMKRKFSVKGMTVGEHNLTLTIYDNNMRAVATKTTRLKIVSSTIATAKNLLTIGDSLTNSKAWLGELRTLSGDRITNVGTRGTTNKHEGRSGWSAATYLTGASYTFEGEGVNPFWDGTRFNWNHYKTTTGISPDAVQIFLGTNGMALDPTTNANNIKRIVDYIRQDDASIPIFVVNTLYRGNQDGIGNEIGSDGYSYNKGAWKLEEDRKVFNLMVRLYELLKGYSKLHFVPIALAHDSEYNFGAFETPINPRAIQTELLPTEATHPQLQGYQQFADIMFSVMAKHLSA